MGNRSLNSSFGGVAEFSLLRETNQKLKINFGLSELAHPTEPCVSGILMCARIYNDYGTLITYLYCISNMYPFNNFLAPL